MSVAATDQNGLRDVLRAACSETYGWLPDEVAAEAARRAAAVCDRWLEQTRGPEQWKTIAGFDHYQVSDWGRIRSVDHVTVASNGQRRRYVGRILRPRTDRDGYRVAIMYADGKPRTRSIHQLVMTTFVGPAPDGHMVRHKDGDPLHNALTNLEYGTHLDNMADMVRHGRSEGPRRRRVGPDGTRYCSNDHAITGVNLYENRWTNAQGDYKRDDCRACRMARSQLRRVPPAERREQVRIRADEILVELEAGEYAPPRRRRPIGEAS